MNTIYTNKTFTQHTPHAHHSIELVYVVSGYIEMDYFPGQTALPLKDKDAVRVSVSSGQFVIIDSNVFHLQYVPEFAHMLILEIDTIYGDILPKTFLSKSSLALNCSSVANLCKSLSDTVIFRDNHNVSSVLSKTLLLLYNNYHDVKDEYFEVELEIQLKRLIISICKCKKLTNLGKKYNSYVSKAMAYIDSHYNEKISNEDLCKYFGISTHQLNVYLKDAFNLSFNQLLINKRLESAKNLLKLTNHSISTIATSVGYNSLYRFESAFKSKFEVTPKEYRQKYEEDGFVFWTDADNTSLIGEDFRLQL